MTLDLISGPDLTLLSDNVTSSYSAERSTTTSFIFVHLRKSNLQTQIPLLQRFKETLKQPARLF